MGIVSEFKDFAMKGNVVDMAVGIVIGTAFGKIVASFVNDVLMPPIGALTGGIDFSRMKITLKPEILDAAGAVQTAATTLNWGNFVTVVIDFIIVAIAIFMVIKAMNKMKKKEEAKPAAPPAPSKEEVLLTEIRDALRAK